jgi:XTP/dITP diphosphohydrolase
VTQLLVASRNVKKLQEMRRIIERAGIEGVTVVGLDEVPPFEEAPETGATFEDNAVVKARDAVAATGLPTVADDSGLSVDALNGMPGVLSARWAGSARDDRANLDLVLDQVTDVPDERLGAAFVCATALVLTDGTEIVVRGVWPGTIVRKPRGTNGFGYDPIFVPEGWDRTMAELADEEKDRISHRGRAFRALGATLATG